MKRKHAETVFRPRSAFGCGVLFHICRCCDRGHRYCHEDCRKKARRGQRREANRKHQQTEDGKADHRDRQRDYRNRQLKAVAAAVTDQSSPCQFPFEKITTTTSPQVAEPAGASFHGRVVPLSGSYASGVDEWASGGARPGAGVSKEHGRPSELYSDRLEPLRSVAGRWVSGAPERSNFGGWLF